jgi:SHS family lactate transporter-like MFS transporter
MSVLDPFRTLNRSQRHAFFASLAGWSLDAFDFFIFVFALKAIAGEFHSTVKAVSEGIFLTLAMRPLGALCFGWLAERYGRRPILMVNIVSYSAFELASAFAPDLRTLLVLRALFGFAMGGEWGVGAALALESLPPKGRGMFSGILQEGYVLGYLLASALFAFAFPALGWRGMFVVGACPALLVLYIRSPGRRIAGMARGSSGPARQPRANCSRPFARICRHSCSWSCSWRASTRSRTAPRISTPRFCRCSTASLPARRARLRSSTTSAPCAAASCSARSRSGSAVAAPSRSRRCCRCR